MIKTKQLILTPLSLEFYEALVDSDKSFFEKAGLKIPDHWFLPDYLEVVSSFISMIALGCDPNFLGWMVQDQKSETIIGDFNFNGGPDNGEVEISYSLLPAYQNMGYGTQIVSGILLWAYFQGNIKAINAQTRVTNKRSQALLIKNGFKVKLEHYPYVDYQFDMKHIIQQFPEYNLQNGFAVSSCLLGLDAKYSGGNNQVNELLDLSKAVKMVPFCPEQLGGLSTPRDPAEIVNNKVITKTGLDVTDAFLRGAEETLKIIEITGQRAIILKDGSPSCGSSKIYDGTFTMTKIAGSGKTCDRLFETYENLLIYNDQKDLIIWQGGMA